MPVAISDLGNYGFVIPLEIVNANICISYILNYIEFLHLFKGIVVVICWKKMIK